MKIFINYNDNIIPLEVTQTSTINKIKEKLLYILDLKPENQFLLFKGSVLKSYNSLSKYNIHDGNVLTLLTFLEECKTIEIIIKTLAGRTIPLNVQPSDKIIDIKFRVQEKVKFVRELPRLIFEGFQLADNRTLADYNIKDKSLIYLVFRLLGGKNAFP